MVEVEIGQKDRGTRFCANSKIRAVINVFGGGLPITVFGRPLIALAGLMLVTMPYGSLETAAAVQLSIPTARQSARVDGGAAYAQSCASCHGAALEGLSGPALAGQTFAAQWEGHPARELYNSIAQRMPLNAPQSLSAAEYRAIDRYILTINGYANQAGVLKPLSKPLRGGATGASTVTSAAAPRELPAAPSSVLQAGETVPTDADLEIAPPGSWPSYNRDYRGQRFSPLDQITVANIQTIRPQCLFQLGETGSFESSPVVFQDRIYITTAHNTYAVDARSCTKIWEYNDTPKGAEILPVNRGVAVYEGEVIRATPDGRLVALDAASGKRLWEAEITDTSHGSWMSAAPVGFAGKVFLGIAGGDRGVTGHIYAFDVKTGRRIWTFDPIPGMQQPGAESWGNGQRAGGGATWSTITVDPGERRLYVPIGNPGSDLDGAMRPGDDLYSDSVVVLDADSGKLLWYVQQVPHDLHDYDTAAAPTIYEINGRQLMAVASKSGWLYGYDRTTHTELFRREISSQLNAQVAPTSEGVHVCPGIVGGAEWNGAAFDPNAKELIVASVDWCGVMARKPDPKGRPADFGGTYTPDPLGSSGGWLRAFDAVTGDAIWADKFDSPMIAGVTATAGGLVFTGSVKGEFLAVDTKNGNILYRFQTGGAIAGGVSSFAVDGRQIIAVTSGNTSRMAWKSSGGALLILFALPQSSN
jgi:alcohol dehydrogenase (cytochrome c)